MIRLTLISLAMSMLANACYSDKPDSKETQDLPANEMASAEVADTLLYDEFVLENLKSFESDDEFTANYPVGLDAKIQVPSFQQNPVLANAVMEWANAYLACNYKGDLKDGKALLQQKLKSLEAEVALYLRMNKVYETQSIVTFVIDTYYSPVGAAHGSPATVGATFRKSDGKIFDYNMFSHYQKSAEALAEDAQKPSVRDELQPILKAGLKKFLEAKSDEELDNQLFLFDDDNINNIPLPETEPWVTKEGIVLLYQVYEIACYAAGQPTITIPLDKAKSLLTPTARKLLY